MTPCSRCGQLLPESSFTELQNELHVTLSGGYGSFIDTAEAVGAESFRLILCEPCGAELCRFLNADAVTFHHHTNTCCTCPENTGRKIDSWARCECSVCAPINALPPEEQHRIHRGGRI